MPNGCWPGCWTSGVGSKGHRLDDWLLIDPGADEHMLLVRRSISSGELAYYSVHTTSTQPLVELVRVAGSRCDVEETFQFTKNETGLDHYQVRRYDAWYRHITFSILAAAFLAVTTRRERLRGQKGASVTGPGDLIRLSSNEIRRLWATKTQPTHPDVHTDHWSHWLLRHQTRARRSRYQRQRLKYNTLRLPY